MKKLLFVVMALWLLSACSEGPFGGEVFTDPRVSAEFYLLNASNYFLTSDFHTDGDNPIAPGERRAFFSYATIGIQPLTPGEVFGNPVTIEAALNGAIVSHTTIPHESWTVESEQMSGNLRVFLHTAMDSHFTVNE